MEPNEQDGECINEARGGVGPEGLAVERAVGEGELQVAGDQTGVKGLAVIVESALHHGEGLDAGEAEPVEVAEHVVLADRQLGLDLLDRQDAAGKLDEADHVPRDAAGERRQPLGRPLLQRDVPRKVE